MGRDSRGRTSRNQNVGEGPQSQVNTPVKDRHRHENADEHLKTAPNDFMCRFIENAINLHGQLSAVAKGCRGVQETDNMTGHPVRYVESVQKNSIGSMLEFALEVVERNCTFHKQMLTFIPDFMRLSDDIKFILFGKSWIMNHILDFIYISIQQQMPSCFLRGGERVPLEVIALMGNENLTCRANIAALIDVLRAWKFNMNDLMFMRNLIVFDISFHPSPDIRETFERLLYHWACKRRVFYPIYYLVEAIRFLAHETLEFLALTSVSKRWDTTKYSKVYSFMLQTLEAHKRAKLVANS